MYGGFATDLVMFDLKLPDVTGISGFQTLRDRVPDTPILVISSLTSVEIVQALMEEGAAGFLPKDASAQVLKTVLHEISVGRKYVPKSYQKGVQKESGGFCGDTQPKIADLTPQQARIMKLICGQAQQADRLRAEPRGSDGEGAYHSAPASARCAEPDPGGGARGGGAVRPRDEGPGRPRLSQPVTAEAVQIGARPAYRYLEVGVSHAAGARDAVAEALWSIRLQDACFLLVFPPDKWDMTELAAALDDAIEGVPVFGCTTAGQISPAGYEDDALLILAFPKQHFRCASILLAPLNPLSIKSIAADVTRHAAQFQHTAGWNRLALVLADGLSKQEDMLVSTLEVTLGDVPIFGGSAGDALRFERTYVLHRGRFHTNAALLLLIETDLRFQGLAFDHFLPTETQLVVTEADPDARLVRELNGAPAAPEYARLVGCRPEDLSPEIFAENPVLVRQHTAYHVRAIHAALSDNELSFLSAIDDGLVLTLGRGKAVVETMRQELNLAQDAGAAPDFILGFDCVLRKLEIAQKQLTREVSDILAARRVLGFNTYGEQHRGVHVNQTFVGVAFFDPDRRALH